MTDGLIYVGEDSKTSQTAGIILEVEWTPQEQVSYVKVDLVLSITETGTDVLTDTGPFGAISKVECIKNGSEYLTYYGVEVTDYAGNLGEVGELHRFMFRSNPYFVGDAALAKSGTEDRSITFKIPFTITKDDLGKTVKVRLTTQAYTWWIAGAGVATYDAKMIIRANQVTYLIDEIQYARAEKTGISDTTDTTLNIPDKQGFYLMGAICKFWQSAAYYNYIARLRVKTTGGVCVADMTLLDLCAEAYQRVGVYVMYAATYTFRPAATTGPEMATGIFQFPITETEAKGLQLLINATSSASAGALKCIFIYTRHPGQASQPPAQKGQRADTSSQGQGNDKA